MGRLLRWIVCGRLLISEDSKRRQGILRSRRHAAVWQVQVAETLHEGVLGDAKLSVRRLQPVATQVLSAHQLHCV